MQKYLSQTSNEEVIYWINHNLKNYLTTNPEDQGEIEHIIDFLNSDKAPKRLQKMSYEEAKRGASKWVKTMNKKGAKIGETEADTKVKIDFGDGFKLVKLKGKAAYDREGYLMKHCVASYYGRDSVKIYSLRDANNVPHCTIEVVKENGEIHQIKGKGNGSIHPKYINYILQSLEKLGQSVRSSELRYLGYEDLEAVTPGFTEFVEKNVAGAKFLYFNNRKYYYVG